LDNDHKRDFLIVLQEIKTAGRVNAEWVPWGTSHFGYLSAMGAMETRPECLGCMQRMTDTPVAFVELYGGRQPSMSLPIPVCRICAKKSIDELKAITRGVIRELFPNMPVRFCHTKEEQA
jgi:hypothetical protein